MKMSLSAGCGCIHSWYTLETGDGWMLQRCSRCGAERRVRFN